MWQTKLELSKNKSDQRQTTHTNTIAQSKENFVDLKSFFFIYSIKFYAKSPLSIEKRQH